MSRCRAVLVTLVAVLAAVPAAPAQIGDDWSLIGAPDLLRRAGSGFEPLPILTMRVELDVDGVMVRGRIVQRFENPADDVIEALYVLPLPERAAVHAMTLAVGSRRIVAQVRETEAARRDYRAARREGRKAALVTERRPNLFRVAVANINPHETVDVEVEFVKEVTLEDGGWSLRMPLTYTPRFDPRPPVRPPAPGDDDRVVPAGDPAMPRVTFEARITAGIELAGVESPSHPIDMRREGETLVLTTTPPQVVADRDLVLRWRPLLPDTPQATLLVGDRDDAAYGLLLAMPEDDRSVPSAALPTETVFVLDVSGSMQGRSIRAARQALVRALGRLEPMDRFSVVTFNHGFDVMSESLLPATAAEVARARSWIDRRDAEGGTRIAPALERALALHGARDDDRNVARRVVLLTDGAVANEAELLRDLASRLGTVRLHVVGIGSAPNAWFVRELARAGRGLAEFVPDAAAADARLDAFVERIARPLWTDLELDLDGLDPVDAFPDQLPDLHAGEPLVVSLRLDGAIARRAPVLVAHRAGRTVSVPVRVVPLADGDAVALRWARARVRALLDDLHRGADRAEIRAQVVALATEFSLVTPFTSLVAVEQIRTAEGSARSVRVPNGQPAGQPIALPQTASLGPLLGWIGALLMGVGLLLLVGAAAFERRSVR
ncbi:MAG: VWA domain-containing protein [Acidobacteria bacterium]|nr:MAG: VWA domain-containing protein [Acidobacteriota bacterium]